MTKLQINGTVSADVDPVDIEQIALDMPHKVSGYPEHLRAMVAAVYFPNMVSLRNQLKKNGFTLTYGRAEKIKTGWRIFFNICELAKESPINAAG